MGICQCLAVQNQDTQSNVPVDVPDNDDEKKEENALDLMDNNATSNKPNQTWGIVTDLARVPSKKAKDDNDISEFIKNAQLSPQVPAKQQDKITIGLYGISEAGKTSLLLRVCHNKFDSCYIPSFSNESMNHIFPYQSIKYQIRFMVNPSDVKTTDFSMLMFDVTLGSSFNFVENFLVREKDNMQRIVIVGNKSDLKPKKVTNDMIDRIVSKYNCEYYEISIKDNRGISNMLNSILKSYIQGKEN